ncbi:tigger transposable element-derived 6-like [Brachionus plicatilis]|uniref:Tigger transposable element-derived 6-like n=1 Tax=Brachionus plicatilis TaxID=10195 RepID=A0A3M7SSE1_BRAPC|nr:tigger transposable element-derived 6-like [Brachionus plicatilis]
MDQGVIQSFKVKYRTDIAREKLNAIEYGSEMSKIDIFSAIYKINRAWDGVSALTIQRCFNDISSFEKKLNFDKYAYVSIDSNFPARGLLSDVEIISSVNNTAQNDDSDSDVEEIEKPKKPKGYGNIFDFLDTEPTKFENLYNMFFEWVLSIPDIKLLEYHFDNLLSLGVENLKKDHNLWNLLKEMKFIKIEKKFYSVNQVYDPENELFRKSLSEFLLPDNLNTNDWRSLLDKLFFEEIDKIQTDDIINGIKDIKFIPVLNNDGLLEYIKPSNSIHGDLICLNDSICGVNQRFSWLIKPVLPKYIKELGNNSGIAVDLPNEVLVKNFLQLIALLSEKKISKFKNMTRYKMNELQKLMMSYYNKFQSIEDDTILDQLKDKNLILVDQIDDFFYKFPEEYAKNWAFFKQLGANESVLFSLCQQVLQHYYSTENLLSKEAFNNVLVAIKHLILENSIDQDNLPKLDLYFPNSRREMKHLNTLYYMDKPSYESIIKNSNDIKSIVLFDIKELINHYQDTYHSNSAENMEQNCSKKRDKYKSFMFKQVSWLSIFENFEYFKTYRDLAPKRLSDKLIEKLKGDGEEPLLDENLMKKLHSDQLFESLIECFEEVNDEEMFDIDKQLKEDVKNCIRSIRVYRMSDLVTQFYDSDNPNNFFIDTEKRVKIARIKDGDGKGINFMIRGDFNDELDKCRRN